MTCEWMVLCEEYDGRSPGNPSIIGMISALVTETLPARIEQLVAAFRLVGHPDEHATISLVVQDETGADVKGHPQSLRLPGVGVCDATFRSRPSN